MNWANYTLIIWNICSLGFYVGVHGQPKKGNYNFLNGLIVIGIEFILLYFGGWFN